MRCNEYGRWERHHILDILMHTRHRHRTFHSNAYSGESFPFVRSVRIAQQTYCTLQALIERKRGERYRSPICIGHHLLNLFPYRLGQPGTRNLSCTPQALKLAASTSQSPVTCCGSSQLFR